MQRQLQMMARHILLYKAGYLVAVFLIIASLTCGVRTCLTLDLDTLDTMDGFTVQLSFWEVIELILRETVSVSLLLLVALHPFGCALAAALLVCKSIGIGYCWGWWIEKFKWNGVASFLMTILPQGVLSILGYAWGGCMSGYAALRIRPMMRREYMKNLLIIWMFQMIAVLLRCIGCAWVG